MIFPLLFLYPCLVFESLVNSASVEIGSHVAPPPPSFSSSDHLVNSATASRHSIIPSSSRSARLSQGQNVERSNSNSRRRRSPPSPSPAVSDFDKNGPRGESPPSGNVSRSLQPRQVSTSEWIFSSLVRQPTQQTASENQQKSRYNAYQMRRSSSTPSGLTYRSIPLAPSSSSNYYTNYYRNTNIYAHTGRRVDGNAPKSSSVHHSNEDGKVKVGRDDGDFSPSPDFALDQSSLSVVNNGAGTTSAGSGAAAPSRATSRTPGAPDLGTTSISRTAPATDPTLLATERPTSTQEMQISNENEQESSTLRTVDDDENIQFGSRAEIGRTGRTKEMKDGDQHQFHEAREPLYFEGDSSPIVFPGMSTAPGSLSSLAETDDEKQDSNTFRPLIRPAGKTGDGFLYPKLEVVGVDPHVLEQYNKLTELKRKSQLYPDARRSTVATDKTVTNSKLSNLLAINDEPKCALKDGYCEHIDSYPRAFFKEVLEKTIRPELFNGIFGETTDNNTVFTDVELKLRLDLDETPLCSVREHTIYPKAAQNRKGKFMYIVNQDEYLQGIRVETCARENDACMFTEGHLPGYTSSCKQKFIYKKLLAFTPDGKAMPDTFRLPSCCVCHVKSSFISDRIIPGAADIEPNSAAGDIQPTVAADDNNSSWYPSSTPLTYPHHDDQFAVTSTSPRSTSSTIDPIVDSGSITFPSTAKDDNSSLQLPSPTTSTQSSLPLPVTHQTGGQNRAENQTANRRLLM